MKQVQPSFLFSVSAAEGGLGVGSGGAFCASRRAKQKIFLL